MIKVSMITMGLAAMAAVPLNAWASPTEDWTEQTQVRGLISAMRTLGPVQGGPDSKGLDCDACFRMPEHGLFGLLAPQTLTSHLNTPNKTPVTTGFKALGPAGTTGKIDGPGRKGNGTYRVVQNEDYVLKFTIATGYVQGTVGLKRDPATGRDEMSFVGKYWDRDNNRWGAHFEATNEVLLSYDARQDSGKIRYKEKVKKIIGQGKEKKIIWQETGQWKEEGYWGGRAGNKSMTIELAGGWDHDFKQN